MAHKKGVANIKIDQENKKKNKKLFKINQRT